MIICQIVLIKKFRLWPDRYSSLIECSINKIYNMKFIYHYFCIMVLINFKIGIAVIHNSLNRRNRNIVSLSSRCKRNIFLKLKRNTIFKIIRNIRVITNNIIRRWKSFFIIFTNTPIVILSDSILTGKFYCLNFFLLKNGINRNFFHKHHLLYNLFIC